MFIATLVILAVLGLIVLSVIWMTPPGEIFQKKIEQMFGFFILIYSNCVMNGWSKAPDCGLISKAVGSIPGHANNFSLLVAKKLTM